MSGPDTRVFPHLSASLTLRGRTLRNRIVFCAHLTNLATDQLPNADHGAYYEARARGGVGLIITEEHTVHPSDRPYEKLIRGYDRAAVPGMRHIADAAHAHGAVIVAQLNHNGAQGSSLYTRRPLLAPSAIWDPMFREVPKPLERHEIAALIDGFARTARHCRDAGYDGVELQCSQASLIRQFLAQETNLRQDGYGGSHQRRARLLLDTIAAVREALGPEPILGVRLSADEGVPGGITVEQAVHTARMVEATGAVDYINTTMGLATSTLHLIEASMTHAPGYALHVPSALRAAVDVPVVGVGRFTQPEDAETALRDGHCDLVGVVRGQIADPDFAAKALGRLSRVSDRAADTEPGIRVCSGCNQECIGRVGFNLPIRCLQNPAAGRESAAHRNTAARRRIASPHVIVVGAGPAGLAAAAEAAEHGARVELYERAARPGGQIALAARAPYRGGLAEITDDLERRCRAAGVQICCSTEVTPQALSGLRGQALRGFGGQVLSSPGAEAGGGGSDTGVGHGLVGGGYAPDAVILATGARPHPPAWARGLPAGTYADVRDVLGTPPSARPPGGRALVVDGQGFHPATSAAEMLAAEGWGVTVCTDAMVVGQDLGVTLDREAWMARAHSAGIAQRTDTVVAAVTGCGESGSGRGARGQGVELQLVHHPTGGASRERFDLVVYAGPQHADDALWRSLGTAGSHHHPFELYRVGDCLAPRRADAAIREGTGAGAASGQGAAL